MSSDASARRPSIAIFKFASCDGCQLSLLDAEDELLAVAEAVEIAYFPEATRAVGKKPYDIALVEGSITTHHDAARIQEIRRHAKKLVTIGACATAGGIQALRNWKDVDEFIRVVYASPQFISTLKLSTPMAEHVPVDFELRGCPINKFQLLELLTAVLAGRKPNIPTHSVCVDCKLRGNVCIAVARGVPCLGPLTQAGCGALCPAFNRGCYGLLRAHGKRQHRLADEPAAGSRPNRRADRPGLPRLQCLELAVPQGGRGVRTAMTNRGPRNIRVNMLARVEGEGSLDIRLAGDRVADVKLKIFEPPRFFEAFLRGRHASEAPDITARICGICPAAYQMSAVHAIERALGVSILPEIRLLRRLLYCGEWIESHALHVYMLHAPDFLGYPDALAMARDHRAVVERALRLKKIGNRLMAVIGGREIHPVSVAIGGFSKAPGKAQLRELLPELEWALDAAFETVRFTSKLEFPAFEQDYEFVALRHPHEYPLNEGRLVSNRGLDLDPAEYEDHFVERHVKHSNALHSVVRGRNSYLTGPLARFNLNFDRLPAAAQQAASEVGLRPPVRNPFRGIIVRAVELVFACAEALRAIGDYEPPPTPGAEVAFRAGVGQAITEAPRGILYHRYAIDHEGLIVAARIVPPTSQNLQRIEDDLREYAAHVAAWRLEEATWKCEQAVRNYDPCISCATHFLKLRVHREGERDS